MVDLAEAVQLVPADIEDQAVVHRGGLKEADRMSLVQFQYGDIIVKAAVRAGFLQKGRKDSSYKVAARFVGKDPESPGFKKFCYDPRGGGLSVGAGYNGNAQRKA